MVTKLWECLSSEMAVSLCNMGLMEEMNINVLLEEIRKSMISSLNKLSQRVELSSIGQHDGENVRKYPARLRGKTD